jgi:AbrB family looped-hinge helix DNA binding protein
MPGLAVRIAKRTSFGSGSMRELAKIAEGGRLVVPARIRKALGVDKGDAVWLLVEEGELRIRPARSALRRIQAQLRDVGPPARPTSAELVASRRITAAHE